MANISTTGTPPSALAHSRTIAAVFMTLLVAWNMAEFAFQPVRRPFDDEVRVFVATAAVLPFIPFLRSNVRWAVWGAFVVGLLWCAFAIAGLWLAAGDQGFGKAGPAVAAVLMAVATYFAFNATRERGAHS
jgi:hypothetical protein